MKIEERSRIWRKWLRMSKYSRAHKCPAPDAIFCDDELETKLSVCRLVCGPIHRKSGKGNHNCPCLSIKGGSEEVARRVRAKLAAKKEKP
jgi:hypothetical protein